MRRLNRLVICIVLGAAIAGPLSAQIPVLNEPATKLVGVMFERKDYSDPVARATVVSAIGGYCEALGEAYPRNSPSEAEWLSNELAGTGERFLRALNSREYGRRLAEKFVGECLTAVRVYEAPDGNRAQALFLLAMALNRFAPDAKSQAEANGIDVGSWAFLSLGAAAGLVSEIGIYEAATSQGTQIGIAN